MKKFFLPLLALLCLVLPARAAGFYDLPADHWAQEEIRRAVDAGVVNGYGDGSFQPGRDVTAAQFCAMLSRSFIAEEYAAAKEGKYQAMEACLPDGHRVRPHWKGHHRRVFRARPVPVRSGLEAEII